MMLIRFEIFQFDSCSKNIIFLVQKLHAKLFCSLTASFIQDLSNERETERGGILLDKCFGGRQKETVAKLIIDLEVRYLNPAICRKILFSA